MRKEFNELVETIKTCDLSLQKCDEVDVALTNLSNKIDEVEKRIECAVRSARELNEFVCKYTEDVDSHKPINMSVDDHDFILNRSSEIDISLDLDDDMCVSDNWYNLFSPKEEPKPIIKKEVFMTFHSSWGEIDCDKDGHVIEVRGDDDEDNYLNDIAVFDLAEYYTFLNSKNITMGEADDILAIGFWKKDNTYHEAEKDWRKEMFAPTMLCADSDKHKIVNNIISQLKEIDVDGETMEYILKQVGMEEQVLKQLFAQSTNDEIDYLHDVRNGKG